MSIAFLPMQQEHTAPAGTGPQSQVSERSSRSACSQSTCPVKIFGLAQKTLQSLVNNMCILKEARPSRSMVEPPASADAGVANSWNQRQLRLLGEEMHSLKHSCYEIPQPLGPCAARLPGTCQRVSATGAGALGLHTAKMACCCPVAFFTRMEARMLGLAKRWSVLARIAYVTSSRMLRLSLMLQGACLADVPGPFAESELLMDIMAVTSGCRLVDALLSLSSVMPVVPLAWQYCRCTVLSFAEQDMHLYPPWMIHEPSGGPPHAYKILYLLHSIYSIIYILSQVVALLSPQTPLMKSL